jgi:RHS repeat-associated protein
MVEEKSYWEAYEIAPDAANDRVQWLIADHLGTPRIIADLSGSLSGMTRHDYLPFGEEAGAGIGGRTTAQGYSQPDGMRMHFTSKERDAETGLDYFGARYYASQQGRFTSPDDFLNDTHANDSTSWNLYAYVRNNPLKYIDPFGEEVYGTELNDTERQKLIEDWTKKTGYKDIQFVDDKLVIHVQAGRSGGSDAYADQLLDATTSTDIRLNLKSVDSLKVSFAEVSPGQYQRKERRMDFTVNIDFGDFDRLQGDKSAKDAFSVGIVTIHEFDHKIYDIRDKPYSTDDPGPLENKYINPGRRELGLPERLHYSSEPVPAAFKSSYPGGGQQIRFKLDGKEKVIRWRHDNVGGGVQ